jgi:hypothetical protein
MSKLMLAFTLAGFCACPAMAFQNEPSGFRGIDWGAPVENFQDQLSGKDAPTTPGLAFYQRKDDKMSIGAAQLTRITYVFYKGRFEGAQIQTAEGASYPGALRDALVAQFGPGDQPNRYIDRWFWRGTQAMILLDCTARLSCRAHISSRAMFEEQQRDKKAAAEKAKKDF